jgi:hypothetical protein
VRPHRRYNEDEKSVVLNTVARAQQQSAQPLKWILTEVVLPTPSTMTGWCGEEDDLTNRVVVPRCPLATLPEEIEAVVVYAKVCPRDGFADFMSDSVLC